MKHSFLYLSAAAALVLAACTQETVPQEKVIPEDNAPAVAGPTSFTASFETDPESKAVLGLNGNNKPQCFWENGDAISLYSSNDTDLSSAAGHKFMTTLSANSLEATFEWDNEGSIPSGDYLATYPNRTAGRGVNFSVSPYRVAAVDVPKSQILVAGTVDRKACPMVAHASEGSTNLEFKNAAALLKFRVSESNIVAGRIVVDAADAISGRFRADVDVTTFIPTLATYTASGVAQYNYIDFTIDGSTALANGTDYYVAIRPTELTSDLRIYLNGNLVKVINKSQFSEIKRNKIYNLGTLSTPGTPSEKNLHFDFTIDPFTGWPTVSGNHHGLSVNYPLYGVDYPFILTDCEAATKCQTYWGVNSPGNRLCLAAAQRYCGLPAINGYKLVQVTIENKQLSASDTSTKPRLGITHTVTAGNVNAPDENFVSGGELFEYAAKGGTVHTYDLSGTADNTVYYIYARVKGAIANLTLTYVPI